MSSIDIYPHIPGTKFKLKDSVLRSFYQQIQNEGTANIVFMDGSVNNADEFVNSMNNKCWLYMIYSDDRLGILVWLNRFQFKWCQLHFVSFKWTWGKKTIQMGKFALKYLINLQDEQGYLFDAFLGITPTRNELACKFMKKLGWQEIGVMPNGIYNAKTQQSESALFSYFNRSCL